MGENVKGCAVDVDFFCARPPVHVQLLEVLERSEVGNRGIEDAGG